MSINNCRKCEWWQPLKTYIDGHTKYGCAWTKRNYHFMIDCPKFAHRTKRGGL